MAFNSCPTKWIGGDERLKIERDANISNANQRVAKQSFTREQRMSAKVTNVWMKWKYFLLQSFIMSINYLHAVSFYSHIFLIHFFCFGIYVDRNRKVDSFWLDITAIVRVVSFWLCLLRGRNGVIHVPVRSNAKG